MADDALSTRTSLVPALLAGGAVVLQIAYPLVHGTVRDHLTVLIVLALAATSLAHAALTRGAAVAAAVLLATALPGFAVEVLGVHTGVPFGRYHYSTSLGPRLFATPLLIGLAWTMLAWPAAIAARRLVRGRVARLLVGAWALAAADLFLDPQLVSAGAWTWRFPAPHLPGVADVPLTNYAGWLAVALVLSFALQSVIGNDENYGADTVPVLVYLWLYVGWIVALGLFLDLGAAAGWGALGMGMVAIPLAIRSLR